MTIQRKISYRLHELVERYPFKGGKKLAFTISKIILHTGEEYITTREGMEMFVNPQKDGGIDSVLYYTGTYEAGVVNVMKRFLKPGNTFLEVGANIGPFSIAASSIMNDTGNIIAIEPDPEIKRMIVKSIKRNNLSSVKVLNVGVSDKESTMKLYLKPYVNRGASSLIAEDGDESIEIKVTTLDKIIIENKLDTVDMVVIDVEGWELNALNGGKKLFQAKKLPLLSVEINSKYDPEKLYSYLASIKGYKLFKLKKGKEFISKLTPINSFTEVRLDDNVFCLSENHIEILSSVIA